VKSGRVEWDGKDEIGAVCMGMTESELRSKLPGRVDDAQDPASFELADDGLVWDSDEFGLSVTVVSDVVVAVHAVLEFVYQDCDIIGLPVAEALWRLGGEVSREEGEIDIIQTALGPELYCRRDEVISVAINRFDLVED
jgi:hypothetical protein